MTVTRSIGLLALLGSHSLATAQPVVPNLAAASIRLVSPQFVVKAERFRALDETHYWWTGSDEVYLVYADFIRRVEKRTTVYGGVDEGETHDLEPQNQCVVAQPNCQSGAPSLYFGVSFWERDYTTGPFAEFCPGRFGPGDPFVTYREGMCPADDLIGWFEVEMTKDQLLAALPNVGDSRVYQATESGGAGKYKLYYRITRLPDNERTITPQVNGLFPINLTATLAGGSQPFVSLRWTGASGPSVDIYRDGALLVTTQNDGRYEDEPAPSGAHRYAVCNAGTSACSLESLVTVP